MPTTQSHRLTCHILSVLKEKINRDLIVSPQTYTICSVESVKFEQGLFPPQIISYREEGKEEHTCCHAGVVYHKGEHDNYGKRELRLWKTPLQ